MADPYCDNDSLTCPLKPVERTPKARLTILVPLLASMALQPAIAAETASRYPAPAVAGTTDYLEGQALLNKKKWAEAAVVFKSVMRRSPDFLPAAMGLARALAFSNRREEALSVLWRFADREKGATRAALIRRGRVISRLFLTSANFQTYQDGLSYLEAKKFRLARERFEKALGQEPDNIEILVRLGQCLALDNDFDSATEHLRLARRLDPHEPEIRLWLGRTMHQRGEIKEAIDELRWANGQLDGSELAPLWLSSALFSYGQKAAAIQVLEEDIKVQPYHLASLIQLAWMRSQAPARGNQGLWTARKELQLVLSRLDAYANTEPGKGPGSGSEGELGLNLRPTPAELKSEANKLLQQIESRLGQGAVSD